MRELEILIKAGHLDKMNNVDQDCFVSPVVKTIKYEKSVQIALDSRKLNDSCIKHRPLMPKKIFDVLNKLEKAGHRASKRKSEFFMKHTKRLGHEIDENGISPNEEKVEAILKLKSPNNTKKFKPFLGAIQNTAKFPLKLSKKNRLTPKTAEKERTM